MKTHFVRYHSLVRCAAVGLFMLLLAGSARAQSPACTVTNGNGKLVLAMDGPEAGVSYDYLLVAGKAQLGGILQLNFAATYTPKVGQEFVVVKATGGLCGSFLTLSNNKGLKLSQRQDANNFYVKVEK